MKRFLTILAFLILIPVAAQAATSTPEEQRAGIQKMREETLTKLYELQPDAKREIEGAAGYAVFSSGELAILWVSGGYGHGVAHNNKNGADTYMQMAKAGLGIGVGAKEHNTVFVFHDLASLDNFINTGLDLTGTADAAAKVGEKGDAVGGAADVLPGVRIYQITDSGLIAQAMVQGTKYWRDDSLN
ncbi:MAG TPA: hypothetical protein VIF12_01445 [Micavibrio sp.]|jgi:lipid-binding SYLF domain-containing protein